MGLFSSDDEIVRVGDAYLQIVGPAYGFYGLGMALYFLAVSAGAAPDRDSPGSISARPAPLRQSPSDSLHTEIVLDRLRENAPDVAFRRIQSSTPAPARA
jgi:hypothetical protein